MKKRIEFIDIAKGICIIEIVLGHCGISLIIPGLRNLSMPLFFLVSGSFFKCYNGWNIFLQRKIKFILKPFCFFYLIAYVAFYVANAVAPTLIKTDASGILDVFTQRQYFNGPIWFLICLFWTNTYFYMIQMFIQNDILKAVCVSVICGVGVILGKNNIFLPCMLDVAMTSLPFFYIGYLLNRTKLLSRNRFDKYNLLFAVGLWTIAFCLERFFDVGYISFHYNRFQGIFILDVLAAICSVLSVLFLCKTIKRLPIVSYCGRYSIILLCTHHMIYRPLQVFFSAITPSYFVYLSAITTLVLCIGSIPLCKKYIPQFCAQN